MMQIKENISLKPYNTFGIDATARYFLEYFTVDELLEIIKAGFLNDKKFYNIGSGSNLLFVNNYDGLILHSCIKGYELLKQTDTEVFLRVGAGEVWDSFVAHCVEQGWGGVENMSLIPGEVGSTPVQNIGAYGLEAKDVIYEVEGILLPEGELKVLSNADCAFGYRDSIFKNVLANKFIITHVIFRLDRNPVFRLEYGSIQDELKKYPVLDLNSIRQAIIAIRQSKLPDTKKLGNAGSFFKNPVITKAKFDALLLEYPSMPNYGVSDGEVKIPAGWLIEQAGWKGKTYGNAGVHAQQALVLVNYGAASGQEIVELSHLVAASVKEKFDIEIHPEVIFL